MRWKKITNKEDYSISEIGEVKNNKNGRILKQYTRKDGYKTIMLGRKTSPLYIHRLVANEFIENKDNLPQVDHINGNKSDNRVENLKWVSASENCYGYGYKNRIENRKKKIVATYKDGTKRYFNSRQETTDYFKCDKSQLQYNKLYKKGSKKDWIFNLVEDIV